VILRVGLENAPSVIDALAENRTELPVILVSASGSVLPISSVLRSLVSVTMGVLHERSEPACSAASPRWNRVARILRNLLVEQEQYVTSNNRGMRKAPSSRRLRDADEFSTWNSSSRRIRKTANPASRIPDPFLCARTQFASVHGPRTPSDSTTSPASAASRQADDQPRCSLRIPLGRVENRSPDRR